MKPIEAKIWIPVTDKDNQRLNMVKELRQSLDKELIARALNVGLVLDEANVGRYLKVKEQILAPIL